MINSKRNHVRWFVWLPVILLLTACSAPTQAPPTPTITSIPPTATMLPPTDTPLPTETPLPPTNTPSPTPTKAPPTSTATETAIPSDTPTASPTIVPTSSTAQAASLLSAASKDIVWIYFIQQGTGGPICGDTAVPVGSGVEQSGDIEEDLDKALSVLFSYNDDNVGGLYNPLSKSNLRVNGVNFNSDNGLMTVDLSGTYKPTGDKCDNTRVKAQVWQTIRQWREVKATNIYLNGIPFGDRVSND